MLLRTSTAIRNALTAVLFLAALLAGVELWLQNKGTVSAEIVAGNVSPSDQVLLVASKTSHHDLRRSLRIMHQPVAAGPAVSIRVNAVGCRGEEIEKAAPEGAYRILMLGDETVFGTMVKDEETVPARLKEFLSRVSSRKLEMINAGVPGYCPMLSHLKYSHDLAQYRPELVILHVDMTDIQDDMRYRNLLIRDGDLASCAHASFRMNPVPQHPLIQTLRTSATVSLLMTKAREMGPPAFSSKAAFSVFDNGVSWIADDPPDLRLQIRHALQPVRELQDTVTQSGGRLLVTTSPVLWQVISGETAPELTQKMAIRGSTPFRSRFPFEVLSDFCREAGIPFCDASPAFRIEKADRLFSHDTPVLSRTGMTLYAREIARFLIANPPSSWSN